MDTFKSQSIELLNSVEQASPTRHVHALSGVPCAESAALIPPLVIRGESFSESGFPDSGERYELVSEKGRPTLLAHPLPKPDGVAYAAFTDYLNCTFPFKSSDLTRFFMQLFACLGERFAPATERKGPLHFYPTSYSLGNSSALFGYGPQGAILSLSGEACHLVPDWPAFVVFLRDKLGARISRWDGAVDDFTGTHSVDMSLQMYLDGKFNAGGNEPTCDQRGNWIKPDGKGRTLYVGKRENGKMARIYEKGMQLGTPWHPWTRWEVELHNTSRIIPFDVLLEPGKYVAGAYPKAMGWVQEEIQRISTIQKTGKISYDASIHHAKNAYGKLINVMLEIEGTPEKVVEKLIREGIPARLNTPSLTGFGK
jgi:phage replication initiation protein